MRYLIFCIGLLPLVAQDAPKTAQEPAPTAQEAKPKADEAKPKADQAKPKADEAKPEADETKPKADETKPEEKAAEPAKEAASAGAPSGPAFTGSIDVGYRWVPNVGGNPDAYRSVVNLGEGPKVFNFDFSLVNPNSKWYDKITAFGSGWGGEPNQTARLDATKLKLYDLHVDYRNIAYYNFLGSFANPVIDQNIFQTHQGFDTRRRMIDMEIRFRPGTRIIPFLAYNRNWGDGRGVSTYVTGSVNEYPVATTFYDKTDQYRGGVNFELSKFHLTLELGGTTFKDDQTLSNADLVYGSRTSPVLGTIPSLTGLLQAERIRGSSVFQRALGTWTPFSWLDVSGSFLHSQPQNDVTYTQNATGNFPDPATFQILSSQSMSATGYANQPHSSGNINLELRPLKRVRILESWMTDRYHTDSTIALNNVSFLTTPVFPNPGRDYLAVNYSRQQIQANIDIFSWLTARGGWRYVWGDAEVRAPVANGVGSQTGQLDQRVGLFGLQVRGGKKLWVNGDAEVASANQVYFRTSLADYKKGTVRARFQLFNSLALTGNFFALYNENPNPNVRFDLTNYQESAGFLWTPKDGKRITVMGDYTRSSIQSYLSYLQPQDLSPALSYYHENAHIGTAVVDIGSPVSGKYAPKFSVGGSFFTSAGTRPTSFYSPILKLSVPVHERIQFFAEWRYYGLSETLYANEGFRANTFTTGLRLVR